MHKTVCMLSFVLVLPLFNCVEDLLQEIVVNNIFNRFLSPKKVGCDPQILGDIVRVSKLG